MQSRLFVAHVERFMFSDIRHGPSTIPPKTSELVTIPVEPWQVFVLNLWSMWEPWPAVKPWESKWRN